MATFFSRRRGLRVGIPGRSKCAQFTNGVLVADARLADELRAHPAFGLEYKEAPDVTAPAEAPAPKRAKGKAVDGDAG